MRNVERGAEPSIVSTAFREHTVTHDMVETRFRRRPWEPNERNERPEHLDVAINAWRQALPLAAAGSTTQSGRANRLGRLLAARYAHTGDVRDLDEAIAALNLSCAATDDLATRYERLRRLGDALLERYEQAAQPSHLDYAISALSEANRHSAKPVTGVAEDERVDCVRSLAAALTARYAVQGDLADLDAAIGALHQLRSDFGTQRAQPPGEPR